MNTSVSQRVTNISGIDTTNPCDRPTELFVLHKTQSAIGHDGKQSIGIKASGKLIEQLLDKLELYHECVTEANAQLRKKIKASLRADGLLTSTERQKDIEICLSAIMPAYNNMVGAILSRAHELKMKLTEDLSSSMQYSKIIENAVQSSIAVTNQLLDFSLLLHL
jgi:hypothetical protein